MRLISPAKLGDRPVSFYVYVLRSESTGRLYIGTTNDLERRLAQHQCGRSKATKGRGPWKLVHAEEHGRLSQARKREHYLKHKPGARRDKRRWVAGPWPFGRDADPQGARHP